jgi:hypothetical protein
MEDPRRGRPVIELDTELRAIRALLEAVADGQARLIGLVSWWPLAAFLAGSAATELVLRLFFGRG